MSLSTVAQALAFAASHPTWRPDMCDNFVGECYGLSASGYFTALDHWNASTQKHPNDASAPAGALLFWGGGQGHVALSAGNGMIWSTDISGTGTVSLVRASLISQKWGKPYLGWAVPQFGSQFAALGPAPTPVTPSGSGTPLTYWGYRGQDGGPGGPDAPDVHQSLLTTRDNSAALRKTIGDLFATVDALIAELAAVKAKLGA